MSPEQLAVAERTIASMVEHTRARLAAGYPRERLATEAHAAMVHTYGIIVQSGEPDDALDYLVGLASVAVLHLAERGEARRG